MIDRCFSTECSYLCLKSYVLHHKVAHTRLFSPAADFELHLWYFIFYFLIHTFMCVVLLDEAS